jgi:hypothetical protein
MAESCSRCGANKDLHLITALYGTGGRSGRIMLYCGPCREWLGDRVGVDIPIDQVDVDCFVEIYERGQSESAPSIAADMVFRGEDPERARTAAARAEDALQARRRRPR